MLSFHFSLTVDQMIHVYIFRPAGDASFHSSLDHLNMCQRNMGVNFFFFCFSSSANRGFGGGQMIDVLGLRKLNLEILRDPSWESSTWNLWNVPKRGSFVALMFNLPLFLVKVRFTIVGSVSCRQKKSAAKQMQTCRFRTTLSLKHQWLSLGLR